MHEKTIIVNSPFLEYKRSCMYHFFTKNKDIIKGSCYVIVGILLGLEAFKVINNIPFMKHLMLIMALYFIGCGLYYSGLHDTLMKHTHTLFKK